MSWIFESSTIGDDLDSEMLNKREWCGLMAMTHQKTLSLLQKNMPCGVFVLSDQMAIGLLKGLREKNIDVPGRIGICGFDDIELTTIAQNASRIGSRSAEILSSILENPADEIAPQQIMLPAELKIRKTTTEAPLGYS